MGSAERNRGARFASFEIPGRIAGKARHRTAVVAGRARTYDDPKNKAVVQRIQTAWADGGRVRLPDGPVKLTVCLNEARPKGHWTSKGALSAAGWRSPFPVRKPDLDNVAKQICDALNGLLWRDDAQVAALTINRFWVNDPAGEEFAEIMACAIQEAS